MNRSLIVALCIILSAPVWIPAEGANTGTIDPDTRSGDRTFISFGGTEIGEDIASVRYIGELVNRSGGAFGAYTYIGDVNDDGRNDTVISAIQTPGLQGMGEDGAVYIYFGKEVPPEGTFDVTKSPPDMRIYSNTPDNFRAGRILTSQFTSGDYNGDGRFDIALHTQFPLINYVAPNPLKNRCKILFAPETGMPKTITLPDDDTLLRSIEIEYCGPVSMATDVPMPYFMETSDVDEDGIDDIVFGGCMNNFGTDRIWYVTMVWGGFTGSAHDPNLTYTILKNSDVYSSFGSSIDLGDIDGDGLTDLVVGSPQKTPEKTSLYQSGTVHIYFNISVYKGLGEIPFDRTEPKVIYGSGEYDRLGHCVILRDLNGDGFDDILASAPEADGPDNADKNCGEIGIFYGGPAGSFPSEMSFEKDYDLLVLGPTGYAEEGGFKLGQMFRIGDLTGDGKADFAAGLMSKDLPPLEEGDTIRNDCGIAAIYDHESIFRNPTGMVRVGYPAKTFTVEGKDIEDRLGFYFSIGDLDQNGIDDLLMSAPHADGMDNDRPRCGEVYLIYTSHLRLWDQTLSGPCYDKGTVFASQGPLTIDTVVMNERPELAITDVRMEIGPAEDPIVFDCSDSGIVITDPYGCIDEDGVSFTMPEKKTLTAFKISFEIGWFFPERDGIDIRMSLKDSEGCILNRHYRDVFDFAKDLSFKDELRLSSNGVDLPGFKSWLGISDQLEIGRVPIIYRNHPLREVQHSDVDVVIRTNQGKVYEVPYSSDWAFTDTVRSAPSQWYNLGMGLQGDPVPPSIDLMPRMDSDHKISVNVDASPPLDPTITRMTPPNGDSVDFGQPGIWDLEIGGSLGPQGDPGGSGVRYFTVSDSNGTKVVTEKGGLTGTYYSDLEFGDFALNVTDPTINFEWGLWGPHPETFTVPPTGFSVRWHGWIETDADSSVRFQLGGRGLGMMILDGKTHIQYDDLEYAPKGEVVEIEENVKHEVILYYKHTMTNKTPSFHFQWLDPEGKLGVVPGSVLSHPSTTSDVTITPEDPDIVVRAVDWVGLVSGNCTYEAEVDPFPPVIDTGKIPHWTRVLDPIIEFTVTDRGSGLDRDSIYYRLLRDGEDYGTWTADGLIYTGYAGDLSFLNMSLKLELERDFSGTIEIVANDLSGNVARTDPIHIAQDRSRPLIEILYPAKGSTIDKKVINLSFSLNDGDGSGIDTSSSVLKFSMNSKDWADLDNPGVWNGDGSLYTVEMLLRKGHYEIAFSAEDKVGNSATLNSNFTVDIPPENEIPVVHINNPVNNSRFFGGWPFILDASGTSDDGLGGLDPMKLTWYSNISGYLGSGMSLKVVFEDEGVHRITLYADDGEYNVSAWIVLNIVQRHEIDPGDEDVPDKDNFVTDLIIASVVIVLLVLVVVAAIAIRRKDKRTPYSEE